MLLQCAPWFQLNVGSSEGKEASPENNDADSWLIENTGNNYSQHTKVGSVDRGYEYLHNTKVQLRDGLSTEPRTFFLAHILKNMTFKPNTTEFIFASRGQSWTRLHVTRCTSRTTYVDVNVTCISKGASGRMSCGVGGIRRTPNPPIDPNLAILDYTLRSVNSFAYFMDGLDETQPESGGGSLTEAYLDNPLDAFTKPITYRNFTELGYLDIKTFESRFSLLWNTLWKVAWSQESVMGGALVPPIVLTGISPIETQRNTTSRIVYPLPAVYVIDRVWLSVYFISVSVMFVAAVFALVMRAMCHAPVVLGFVSSLTRDSKYFEGLEIHENSTEDGAQRAQRLGSIRVMVGDVKYDTEGVGKIAFIPASIGRRVEMRRWYK
jgi:hypothetical protein